MYGINIHVQLSRCCRECHNVQVNGLQEAMLCLCRIVISQADVAAGLSLGEYTALTFAGALKYAAQPPCPVLSWSAIGTPLSVLLEHSK